jgi:hypothetical protein
MSAVDKDAGSLPFQTKSEVDISTEPIWNMFNAIFIKFIVDLRIGMLKHVFLTLENTQH